MRDHCIFYYYILLKIIVILFVFGSFRKFNCFSENMQVSSVPTVEDRVFFLYTELCCISNLLPTMHEHNCEGKNTEEGRT